MKPRTITTVCCKQECLILPELEALLEGALLLFEAEKVEESAALVYIALDKLKGAA